MTRTVGSGLGFASSTTPTTGEPTKRRSMRCDVLGSTLILVGFEPYHPETTGFPTAVKSIVALRHVDPPTPWGEGPENNSLANEVLDELHRRNLISDIQKAYYAGSCTKAEARTAHLSDDPVLRAAEIVAC